MERGLSIQEACMAINIRAAQREADQAANRLQKNLQLLDSRPPSPGVVPSGPRKRGEGVEDDEQGIIGADETHTGGVRLRVTLLAAGFIIGPAGASIRAVSAKSGASISSWSESFELQGKQRRVRTVMIEGPVHRSPGSVVTALSTIYEAVERYKELCEGKYRGKAVDRVQFIRGVEFYYSPPPRSAVPYAAALKAESSGSPIPSPKEQHSHRTAFSSFSPCPPTTYQKENIQNAIATTAATSGLHFSPSKLDRGPIASQQVLSMLLAQQQQRLTSSPAPASSISAALNAAAEPFQDPSSAAVDASPTSGIGIAASLNAVAEPFPHPSPTAEAGSVAAVQSHSVKPNTPLSVPTQEVLDWTKVSPPVAPQQQGPLHPHVEHGLASHYAHPAGPVSAGTGAYYPAAQPPPSMGGSFCPPQQHYPHNEVYSSGRQHPPPHFYPGVYHGACAYQPIHHPPPPPPAASFPSGSAARPPPPSSPHPSELAPEHRTGASTRVQKPASQYSMFEAQNDFPFGTRLLYEALPSVEAPAGGGSGGGAPPAQLPEGWRGPRFMPVQENHYNFIGLPFIRQQNDEKQDYGEKTVPQTNSS